MARRRRSQVATISQQALRWENVDLLDGLTAPQLEQLLAVIAELLVGSHPRENSDDDGEVCGE